MYRYCSPNSWWSCAYLGLGEWSLKDSEQLLEDVLLNSWWSRAYLGIGEGSLKDPEQLLEDELLYQQLLAICYRDMGWRILNSCLRMYCSTAGGHVLTLDSVNGA
jgi:hypothetical protein